MREKRFLAKKKNNVIKFIADDEQLTPFVSRNQRERVRQMIESLLAKMLDGPLDDVPVVQLSSSEDCEYIPRVHMYMQFQLQPTPTERKLSVNSIWWKFKIEWKYSKYSPHFSSPFYFSAAYASLIVYV